MESNVKIISLKRVLGIMTLAFIGIFVMNSCSDDNESALLPEFNSSGLIAPNAQNLKNLRNSALDALTQLQELGTDDNGNINFTSDGGAVVRINANCLTFNGDPLEEDDTVEVEFIELYDRGNLLTTNIATMGQHEDGETSMLVTGGAFYINVYKDGVPADSGHCGYMMNVPASNTGGLDEEMLLWYGSFDENDNLIWEEANGEGQAGGEISANPGDPDETTGSHGEIIEDHYRIWASEFGWTNVDRFYGDARPKTEILAEVPSGYDPENTSVYLSYDGELGLARLDFYNEETGYFNEHYGLIPIGMELHAIMISESDGKWIYAVKSVTMEEGMVITFIEDDLQTATEEELANIVNELP